MKISKIIAPGETIIYRPKLSKWAYLRLGSFIRNLTSSSSAKSAPSRATVLPNKPDTLAESLNHNHCTQLWAIRTINLMYRCPNALPPD